MAFALALQGVQLCAHQMKVMQRAADVLLQARTRRVEADAGGHAVKQLRAQLVFQPKELPVGSAGGHQQVLRGLADGAATGDLKKILQDDGMHMLYI